MASWARRLSADAIGWLGSDLIDVVAVLPGNPGQSGAHATENAAGDHGHLDDALARWSRRFARERLLVLAPRALVFALSLGVSIALVIAVSGAGLTLAVALCLVVPPLVGLGVVLVSSWRHPSQPEVARVLDRDLALDERLGTAVEIAGAGRVVDGLAALVVAEASSALMTSHLSGARTTHRSVQREWLVIAGALLIISGLLVVIAGRGESLGLGQPAALGSVGQPAGSTPGVNAGGAKHARPVTGRTRAIGPGHARATTPSLQSDGRNSALSVVTQPQSSTAGGRLPAGGGNQRTPPGALGKPGSQTAGLGAKAGTQGVGGAAGRAGSSSSTEASTQSAGSSHGAAGSSHADNPQRVGGGGRAGTFGANRISASHGSAKAPTSGNSQPHASGNARIQSARSNVHTQRSPGGHARSVGSGAGAGSGGNPLGRSQSQGLPSGLAGRTLPIQAGYTAAHNRSGPRTGNPAGRSGGRGRARSSTENGAAPATAVTLPYIPPSADIGPVDNALLQQYFSSAPTVPRRW